MVRWTWRGCGCLGTRGSIERSHCGETTTFAPYMGLPNVCSAYGGGNGADRKIEKNHNWLKLYIFAIHNCKYMFILLFSKKTNAARRILEKVNFFTFFMFAFSLVIYTPCNVIKGRMNNITRSAKFFVNCCAALLLVTSLVRKNKFVMLVFCKGTEMWINILF